MPDLVDLHARRRLGSVLEGGYRLDDLLGVGGMSAVYAATSSGREYAVKVVHPALARIKGVRARFFRDGYAGNVVDHPGAVAAYAHGRVSDKSIFLVLESLDARSIASALPRFEQKRPIRAALAVADQLLEILAAGHAKGILHRGVNPSKVLLLADGSVRLLGFGMARVRELFPLERAPVDGLAPEQARPNVRLDGRTDVFGVGAFLFSLLAGSPLREGSTRAKVATLAAPSLRDAAPAMSPALVALVDRATAFDVGARFAGAEAMRAELATVYTSIFAEPLERRATLGLLAPSTRDSGPDAATRATVPLPATVPYPVRRRTPRRWSWRVFLWIAIVVIGAAIGLVAGLRG